MNKLLLCGIALAALAPAAAAQRRVRIGGTASSISIEDGNGQAHAFPSIGGSLAVQALEARANVSVAFGKPRPTQLLAGTVGPEASYLIHLSGPLEARAPFVGVRFRRDTKKAGAIGLQIDYAPFKITGTCSSDCQPTAILFAPGYEASAHPSWGRLYGVIGALLAGFYTQGPDRGVAQGAHGGLGADINSGKLLWNVNARVLWLQRSSGENVFGVQAGVSVMPKPR